MVTAVAAERDSAARGLHALGDAGEYGVPGAASLHRVGGSGGPLQADLLAAGVGPGAAGAGASAALSSAFLRNEGYDLVVSCGIGGGFAPVAPVGSVVVADTIVAADLGADSPAGFLSVEELGFGTSVHRPPPALASRAADALDAVLGPVLTVSTVTGTEAGARGLAARHPGAAAEAMEGFGVAEAAFAHSVPVLEIRAVSNPVGPRDRDAWRIPGALAALTVAFGRLVPVLRAPEGAPVAGRLPEKPPPGTPRPSQQGPRRAAHRETEPRETEHTREDRLP